MEEMFVDATIYGLRTTIDGGMRITLDLGAESIQIIQQLLNNKMRGRDLIKVCFVDPEVVNET